MQRKITTIPASIEKYTNGQPAQFTKRKVAAYARVSTDFEEQQTSYHAQIDYYENLIKGRSDWDFVKIYTDEGISGTSTKRRKGFQSMINDAMAGKIDLIVTKSVSRFARNTVDSLSMIRKLKESNVEIYFEKENIWTFDSKGELLITIMSSLAQEESRSISENCKWGQRKSFADGKVTMACKRFLGYDHGPNGELVVNPEQAEIVKGIYALFIQGGSFNSIANQLNAENIQTPTGNGKWTPTRVKSILTNERYKGDALLQKYYISDFLTKKVMKNTGQIQQYYVENNHEAIIDNETFELTQLLVKRIGEDPGRFRSSYPFAGRIKCSHCGSWYGRKTWHSNSQYKRVVWQCNNRSRSKTDCGCVHLYEDQVEDIFVNGVRELLKTRKDRSSYLKDALSAAFSTTSLEEQQADLVVQIQSKGEELEALVTSNTKRLQNQKAYEENYNKLFNEYENLSQQYNELSEMISDKRARKTLSERFINELDNISDGIDYSEERFLRMVNYITVLDNVTAEIVFKDNSKTLVPIPQHNPTCTRL